MVVNVNSHRMPRPPLAFITILSGSQFTESFFSVQKKGRYFQQVNDNEEVQKSAKKTNIPNRWITFEPPAPALEFAHFYFKTRPANTAVINEIILIFGSCTLIVNPKPKFI